MGCISVHLEISKLITHLCPRAGDASQSVSRNLSLSVIDLDSDILSLRFDRGDISFIIVAGAMVGFWLFEVHLGFMERIIDRFRS